MRKNPALRLAIPILATSLSIAVALGIAGSSSLNDPLYPWMGNGGYDAQDYAIDLRVPADHKTLQGVSVMTATATDDLSSFNLDLGSLNVNSVLVNGVQAAFKHADPELTVTPAAPITKGSSFRVAVSYSGAPGSVADADPRGGWTVTPTGAAFVSQPTGLMQIAAVNDSPADKASFSFRLTAPQSEQAIANGIFLNRVENQDGTATSAYRIAEPTTSYMPMLAFGPFKRVDGGKVGDVQIRNYLLPNTAAYYQPALAKTADMLRFFNERLGQYPFSEYGIITHDYAIGGALENQTLSSFPASFGLPDDFPAQATQELLEEILAHELAHQWFGALVSYRDHSQIFIHEGFAQFLGRLWLETSAGVKMDDTISEEYPSMVYAKDGGYFEFSKEQFVGLLKQGLSISPSKVLDAQKVSLALDLIFSGTLPSALKTKVLENTAVSAGLTITQLADQVALLPFADIAVTRRINRELRRLFDPSVAVLKPSPAPGKIAFGDDPFNQNVYNRGSAALYALRLEIGDTKFFEVLRNYLNKYRFAIATNEDFLRTVGELGGAKARALTERWVLDDQVPDFPALGLRASDFRLGTDFKP